MPTIKKVLFIISRLLLVGVIVGYLSLDFGYFVQESYFLGTTFGGLCCLIFALDILVTSTRNSNTTGNYATAGVA